MTDLQARLDYADAVAEWFLDLADEHMNRGESEEVLKCDYIAAGIYSRQNRILYSSRIETHLRRVASTLQDEVRQNRESKPPGRKQVCLHVVSEALPAGGLTAMSARWIKNDSGRVHNVALLSQEVPVPERLVRAVSESGGTVSTADRREPLLGRAVWLRALARNADYVILHTDVCDVICGAAFGIPGGPPVLLVNHAAHIFWNGVSFVDRVLNCRGSRLEGFWTAQYRGVPEHEIVPIPLPDPQPLPDDRAKAEAKKGLGLPTDATVIMTVGASFKFAPMPGIDFVEVCERVLREAPNAFLLAVGFVGDARWSRAAERVGGRIRTLGVLTQAELACVHQAADIYIDGFPFGTTTALLESALKGIPVVLSPDESPPPYGTDGIAFDDTVARPHTIEDFKTQVVRLAGNPALRSAAGAKVRASVIAHHTGAGWRQHLERTLAGLPSEHGVRTPGPATRTPEQVHQHWSMFLPQWTSGYETSVEMAVRRALCAGLKPRLTPAFRQACRRFHGIRAGHTVPLPVLDTFCRCVLPLVPTAWAGKVFRFVAFACRGSLLSRLRQRLGRLLGLVERPISPYEEYRRVRTRPESLAPRNAAEPLPEPKRG